MVSFWFLGINKLWNWLKDNSALLCLFLWVACWFEYEYVLHLMTIFDLFWTHFVRLCPYFPYARILWHHLIRIGQDLVEKGKDVACCISSPLSIRNTWCIVVSKACKYVSFPSFVFLLYIMFCITSFYSLPHFHLWACLIWNHSLRSRSTF